VNILFKSVDQKERYLDENPIGIASSGKYKSTLIHLTSQQAKPFNNDLLSLEGCPSLQWMEASMPGYGDASTRQSLIVDLQSKEKNL
jgi:hypothetical protein